MNHWPLTILHTVAALIKLAIPLVLVRVFSLEQIGDYKLFFLYLYLLPELFLVAGLTNGLGYWAGEKESRSLLSSATLMMCIATLLAPLTLIAYFSFTNGFMDDSLISWAFVVWLAFTLPRLFFEELLVVLDRVWESALFRLIGEFLRGALMIAVALLTHDLAISLLVSAAIGVFEILCYLYFYSYRSEISIRFVRLETIKKVLSYALPLTGAGVAIILFERVDQFLLGEFIARSDFALYAMGCLAIPPLLILEQSVTRLLIPTLSREHNGDKWSQSASLSYKNSIGQLAFWMIPSAIFVILSSQQIVTLLFTDRYLESASYLQYFALIYILMVFPYDVVPRALGQSGWIVRTYLLGGTLALFSVAIGALSYGAIGALLGLLFSQAIVRAYGTWYASQSFAISLSKLLPLSSLVRIILCALGGGIAIIPLRMVELSDPVFLLVAGVIYSLIFLTLWILFPSRVNTSKDSENHVLQLSQYLVAGGLERVVVDLALHIDHTPGWRSSVVSYDALKESAKSHLVSTLENAGVKLSMFQKQEGFCLRTIRDIASLVSEGQVRIIHTHDLGSLIYGVSVKLLVPDTPVLIHTQHSFIHLERNKRYAWYERFFTIFADVVVPVSEYLEQTYERLGVPKRKLEVIPNGVVFNEPAHVPTVEGTEQARRALCSSLQMLSEKQRELHLNNDYWFVYLARIYPGKGQREMLQIWNELDPHVKENASLFFVGPAASSDKERALKRLVADSADSERICFVGNSDKPSEWYKAATITASCSIFEGHPLVPIEAMGNGSAFLASDIEGHRYIAGDATLYSLGDYSAASEAINQMCLSRQSYPEAWFQSRAAKMDKMRKSYSFTETVQSYMTIYREQLGQNKPAEKKRERLLPQLSEKGEVFS